MRQGLQVTVASAIKGHGKMPARGGIADLTDTELRAAILYMFYPGAALSAPSAAAALPADPRRTVADDMDVFLGVAPAGAVSVQDDLPERVKYGSQHVHGFVVPDHERSLETDGAY